MLRNKLERVLIVDPKDPHLNEENAIVIHPAKIGIASMFVKGSFDKAVIKNSPTEYLKALGFFNIAQALKVGGTCEVYVEQPIAAMQDLDKEEIDANAKLGGFNDIVSSPYEYWETRGGKDYKLTTIKITMVRAEKK